MNWAAFYDAMGGHVTLRILVIPALIALAGWFVHETRIENGTDGLPDDRLAQVDPAGTDMHINCYGRPVWS